MDVTTDPSVSPWHTWQVTFTDPHSEEVVDALEVRHSPHVVRFLGRDGITLFSAPTSAIRCIRLIDNVRICEESPR
ncbi:hypothetical protein ACIBSV_46800 [Embleya sp. NPDC050154]|uniref:hypothetical protein n=1 Tax=Embleya sp. NPDC050154 TaxID=3363988 RepID=UPI0037A4B7B9